MPSGCRLPCSQALMVSALAFSTWAFALSRMDAGTLARAERAERELGKGRRTVLEAIERRRQDT